LRDVNLSAGTPSKTRYAHTNLIADDWRRLADFYVAVFDCVPVSSEREQHGRLTDDLTGMPGARIRGRHLRLPGHGENGPTLEVFSYEKNAPHPPTELHRPGFQHLAFEVDDIHAKREQILALGGRDVGKLVTLNIAGAGVLTLIYMTDPEGNIIELQKWN
jgi:catechol 2,3-dioxygenase-like lactoylglutathione lyase family enzyme